MARAIAIQRGTTQEPIILLLNPDAQYLIAMLGVLKAGKFFGYIDPSTPIERQRSMLKHTQAQLIITNNSHADLGAEIAGADCRVLNVDNLNSDLPTRNLEQSLSPEMPAKISFTSGSTGEPKCVIQTHRYVLHKVVIDRLFISGTDRLAQVGKISSEVFNVLLNGAAFYSWDVKREGFTGLADWLTAHRITVYRSVPTVFRHFCTELSASTHFETIRRIILGGEPVYKHDVRLYQRHFTDECALVNKFGGAEAGSICYYVVNKDTEIADDIVPIGYCFPGKEVALLSNSNPGAVCDFVGEIAVKSKYLSPGYLGRPDLTQASFFPDPQDANKHIYHTGDLASLRNDGCLIYRGRKDSRVKVRGNSVEISAIEAAIFEHPGVKDATVNPITRNNGEVALIAYYVPLQPISPSTVETQNFLRQKLPDHMIPAASMILDKLPLLLSGKIDRKALPIPDLSKRRIEAPYAGPTTTVEIELTSIWSAILSVDQVGIHDNFFELGGHSLAATRVVSRVIQEFQLELPVKALFDSPTVAEMAKVIEKNRAKTASSAELGRMLNEIEAMSEEKARADFESLKGEAS